tara:strand:+ start:242 stop:502 length:261 start_codon:yes stop_codon:yes gene_type:complete
MPSHYGSDSSPPASSKKETMSKEPSKSPSGKMSDKQKADLKRHMEKHKDLQDLTPSQLKSHRMKMMTRMRKGMSVTKAHNDIKKSS